MEITLTAADGYRPGATTFGSGERALLVMPATGVPQSYYSVLTFDYRGIGRSLSGHVRDVRARMQDWALLDAAAAVSFLAGKRIRGVRHSFGGQALGLLPDLTRITAAILVGSQSGYWKNWPLLGRAWM